MSVFTPLTTAEMQSLLAEKSLTLVRFSAASDGIENSNFFVSAVSPDGIEREFVLTLLETLDATAAAWFSRLLVHLGAAPLPVPVPQLLMHSYHGKPVLLAPRLAGHHPVTPTPAQARAVGQLQARLHALDFRVPLPIPDERARLQTLAASLTLLPAKWQPCASQLLQAWAHTYNPSHATLIHGDLFRDNTLFTGDQLTGVLDFYHACYDLPVYDLAVCLNDWALDEQAHPHPELATALLAGYQTVAALPTPALLPLALAVAALRFWLSRLVASQHAVTASSGRGSKPPAEFAAKLALRWQELEGTELFKQQVNK